MRLNKEAFADIAKQPSQQTLTDRAPADKQFFEKVIKTYNIGTDKYDSDTNGSVVSNLSNKEDEMDLRQYEHALYTNENPSIYHSLTEWTAAKKLYQKIRKNYSIAFTSWTKSGNHASTLANCSDFHKFIGQSGPGDTSTLYFHQFMQVSKTL